MHDVWAPPTVGNSNVGSSRIGGTPSGWFGPFPCSCAGFPTSSGSWVATMVASMASPPSYVQVFWSTRARPLLFFGLAIVGYRQDMFRKVSTDRIFFGDGWIMLDPSITSCIQFLLSITWRRSKKHTYRWVARGEWLHQKSTQTCSWIAVDSN
jgi:hypothetical protein